MLFPWGSMKLLLVSLTNLHWRSTLKDPRPEKGWWESWWCVVPITMNKTQWRLLCGRKATYSCIWCATSGRESWSSCCCRTFLRLWMFKMNCEAQRRFPLVAFEKTKQLNINFYEILCTLMLHRSPCDSFSAHSGNENRQKCYSWRLLQPQSCSQQWESEPQREGQKTVRTCMCCFFLVCHAICSSSLKKDKLKSQRTKWFWFAYWMCLDTSVWFQTF